MMETRLRLTITHASKKILSTDMPFIEMFRHGTTVLEYYKPIGVDLQEPHFRDELYFVVYGSGYFVNGSSRHKFESGEALFVSANTEHHFEAFTPDFATWVVFYGADGGHIEASA
jgi:mannose-6-phosphate isomerase-like protein (cupin superfamily)